MPDPQPTEIQVWTNSFEIRQLPTAVWYHYDVINPDALFKRRNYEIMEHVQLENAAIFTPRAVYDGRKNLFSLRDFPAGTFTVALGRTKKFDVFIKRVSVIRPSDVQKLCQRRSPGDPSDSSMSLNLLQLIVRQAPNMRHKFPADARSFYISHNAKDLRIGLSAWRGYFQSVRPVLNKLIINVDVSHAAVYTPGPLIDTMMQHLGLSDVRQLETLRPDEFGRLRIFLKGVAIKVTLSNSRPRPIKDLVLQAGLQEFDKENERWTVARHFEHKYNRPVRLPRIVGIRMGATAIIPAEFCQIVPGQVYRKKLPPETQKDFLGFSTQKPAERLRDIQNAVSGQGQLFDYATSDFMREAGMSVKTDNAMSIPGLVIAPPRIRYRNDEMRIAPRAGSWNVVGKQFIQPGVLHYWGVAVFDRAAREQDTLMEVADLGVRAGPPQGARYPQLIIVILPNAAPDCRRAVKHWGDIQRNISTQCVWGKANDQYCNNVALKINSRIGGTNSVIMSDATSFLQTCMVVGADVGHPGPGAATRPSVTGLVASVDPAISRMTSYAHVQAPRTEIIEDLETMMVAALTDYQDYYQRQNKKVDPPKTIVFYRDGVSEGEFAQVAAREIPMVKNAFVRCNIPKALMPKLIFIVVGKRHHIRFFPQNPTRDGDRSGNCPAGLLIHQTITNPNYPDFYLQSHAGLLGTSRPAHYVVLENEAGLSSLNLQTLTFHLCHMYASATRSVSIPAPVYYADRICSRMEFHCEDGASLSDTASNFTSGNPEFNLAQWKAAFKPTALNKRMYFL
ncbi:hypothetical protein VTO73DRAFT_13435 [Trametes versicolor]